jgi:hypothetical protein
MVRAWDGVRTILVCRVLTLVMTRSGLATDKVIPNAVPPRRSMQLSRGFGMISLLRRSIAEAWPGLRPRVAFRHLPFRFRAVS